MPLLLSGGNVTRTETFNGAIVSGTWPDPDPFYTTKPLEVCQSHTRAHTPTVTGNSGATRVLSLLLSMLLLGLLLNLDD